MGDFRMRRLIERCFLGVSFGLLAALLVLLLIQFTELSIDSWQLFATGGLLGLVYIGLVSIKQHPSEHILTGLSFSLFAWIILALSLYPMIQGKGNLWHIEEASLTLPYLFAYLLQGALMGLFCGLSQHWWLISKAKPSKLDMPPVSKRVVILGGGYAGVTAAQVLEQEFKDDPRISITLVSKQNYMVHTPMLSEVSASAVNPQNISPPLRNFFKRVQVVQGTVVGVDLDKQQVKLAAEGRFSERGLQFDQLALTLGATPNFYGNVGLAKNSFTFKSLDDAVLLRNQIIENFEKADFEQDPKTRQPMITFAVAGGGFAGVELIGAINDFARGMLYRYPNIPPEDLRLILIHTRDRILPELSETLGKYAQRKLEERGVEFILNTRVTGAEEGKVHLGDTFIETDTFIWTAGSRPNPVLESLGLSLNKRGQIPVTSELQVEGKNLWAAGDCAEIPDLVTGKNCPPTAQYAVRQGKVLGKNLAATFKGKPLTTFEFKMLGSLAALGHQLAVAEVFGKRFSGLFAWLMWRAIYLAKLPTFEKQLRVGLDWFLDVFFPADIVDTSDSTPNQTISQKTNAKDV